MEKTGFLAEIILGVANLNKGRKYLDTDGLERSGRILYEKGISAALDIYQKVLNLADPQTLLLCELTFLQQEFHFCNETDASTLSSLTQAIQSFEDALRCLEIVEKRKSYKEAEATYSTALKYRYCGFPRDAVHLACAAHRTRLRNSLRTPGINMKEKDVLIQRARNMNVIQTAYMDKQKKALYSQK